MRRNLYSWPNRRRWPTGVALAALTLHFRLFDSLGRQMALIESDLSKERLSRLESRGRKRKR